MNNNKIYIMPFTGSLVFMLCVNFNLMSSDQQPVAFTRKSPTDCVRPVPLTVFKKNLLELETRLKSIEEKMDIEGASKEVANELNQAHHQLNILYEMKRREKKKRIQ
jgi:hypothetical protein